MVSFGGFNGGWSGRDAIDVLDIPGVHFDFVCKGGGGKKR